MTTPHELLPHGGGTPLPQVDPLRLAAAAYLARYKDASRVHTESDLRAFLTWCAERDLDPLIARRGFVNANWPHPDGGKWPHLVNGVGGSAAGRTGAFAFYVSQVRTPLLHGLKTVVPPVDQGSAVGRGYGPAPHASRALRVPAGPAEPALDSRVPAGPGQGKLRAGRCPAR